MECETLEGRTLLAVSLVDGVLSVGGTERADMIVVADAGSAPAGVVRVHVNGVRRTFAARDVVRIIVVGRGGSDRVDFSRTSRPGLLKGNDGKDTLIGGSGPDRIIGGSGNDLMDGRAGNDRLDGSAGSDRFTGGAGDDTADYSSRTSAVMITLGVGADDGEAREDDDVGDDVEAVLGGSGADRIEGADGSDAIHGGAGDDMIIGRRGNDTLAGGAGDDSLYGGAGTDRLTGDAGNDHLWANGGRSNFLSGGAGDDRLRADNREAGDAVDGGSGRDWATLDFWIASHDFLKDHARNIEIEDLKYR